MMGDLSVTLAERARDKGLLAQGEDTNRGHSEGTEKSMRSMCECMDE